MTESARKNVGGAPDHESWIRKSAKCINVNTAVWGKPEDERAFDLQIITWNDIQSESELTENGNITKSIWKGERISLSICFIDTACKSVIILKLILFVSGRKCPIIFELHSQPDLIQNMKVIRFLFVEVLWEIFYRHRRVKFSAFHLWKIWLRLQHSNAVIFMSLMSLSFSLWIMLHLYISLALTRGRPIIGTDIKHFTDYRYRPF